MSNLSSLISQEARANVRFTVRFDGKVVCKITYLEGPDRDSGEGRSMTLC